MEQIFLPNDSPLLSAPEDVSAYLAGVLEKVVTEHPPKDEYKGEEAMGAWVGPSGISYLFLHLSVAYPLMKIQDHDALHWANAYLAGKRIEPNQELMCGLVWEPACFLAVRAAVTKSREDVEALCDLVPQVIAGDYADEMTYGRSGFLYLLRMVRHWVPECADLTTEPARRIAEVVLANGPDWTFVERRFIGAGHGDIGNLTQVALTVPELASRVEPWLERILDWQQEDGGWEKIRGDSRGNKLVQYCHGAPGMVMSFVRLRPLFPNLHDKIDAAVEKGRALTWKEGVLVKEPSMCHGTLGNAM